MDIDLSGRKAFISGSTQGIGRAIAAGLARSGAAVTVNGRDEQRVEAAVEALRGECPGAEIDGVAADVATAEGAQQVFDALPTLDILVNNLGIFAPTPVFEIDDAHVAALLGGQRDVRDPARAPLPAGHGRARVGPRAVHGRATRRS